MAGNTPIEWTDATWNPIRARRRHHGVGPVMHVGWHCEKVSAGCDNCYAQGFNQRLGTKLPFKPGHLAPRGEVEVFLDEKMLTAPLRWKKPRQIFVNSMTDSFGRWVTDDMLDRMFAVMALCPQHTFQVLTKRPERMRAYLATAERRLKELACDMACEDDLPVVLSILPKLVPPPNMIPNGYRVVDLTLWPLPNVWLGTSVEDQATADERIPHLLATPAAIRFVSAEPLLGPVTLDDMCDGWKFYDALRGNWWHDSEPPSIEQGKPRLDWVIVGGESGPGARPMHPDWPRHIRDQCVSAGVPFFFKQWGEWGPLETTAARRTAKITGHTPRAQWHHAAGLIIDTPAAEDGLTFFSEGQVFRLGKKAAGRLLDGCTWDQMPGVAA